MKNRYFYQREFFIVIHMNVNTKCCARVCRKCKEIAAQWGKYGGIRCIKDKKIERCGEKNERCNITQG